MKILHTVDGKPVVPTSSGAGTRLIGFLASPWRAIWEHRDLILTILQRELNERFKGSVAGWVWAFVAPLISLATYAIVFNGAVRLPNQTESNSKFDYALFIFGGLVAFNFFSEMAYRAPILLHEYSHFIKHTIFPADMLPVISTLRAGVYAGIGLVLMIVAQGALTGTLHWTVLLLPVWAAALLIFLVGLTWFLSSLGAFTRDVSYLIMTLAPLLMFATPVFFSQADLPAPMDTLIYFNLLTVYIDIVRELVVFGRLPSMALCLWTLFVTSLSFWGGYWFFHRNRSEISDVV